MRLRKFALEQTTNFHTVNAVKSLLAIAFFGAVLSSCVTLDLRPTKRIEALVFVVEDFDASRRITYPYSAELEVYRALRDTFNLDSVLANVSTPYEKVMKLTDFTHGLGMKLKRDFNHELNVGDLMVEMRSGENLPHNAPAVLLTGAAQAIGLKARTVFLMTNDCQETKESAGHFISEVWMDEVGRWAMFDPEYNVVPVVGDYPLSALDLQASIVNNRPYRFMRNGSEVSSDVRVDYLKFIPHRLFYFATSYDQRVAPDNRTRHGEFTHLMLVPSEVEIPVVFQREYPLDAYEVTHNKAWFYAAP